MSNNEKKGILYKYNNKNQCLYKHDILSSLIRLPTKIKQDGIMKSYNIDNLKRQKNNYYSRPISISQNKTHLDSNSNNNLNKIEIIINTLNDIFNQIQILFLNEKNFIKLCNDWIKIFNNNVDFIIEMTESHEYLPLINYAINLIFITIILLYDLNIQNKIQFFFEDIKNILNIYKLLTEKIYERCISNNKLNLKQESIVISVSCKDLYNNLNKIISNYIEINNRIGIEFINLFKKLRLINTNDIHDFFINSIQSDLNEKISTLKQHNHYYFSPLSNNNNNNIYINIENDKNQKRSNSYKKLNSKIITPGNFITTDINYIGAALTNSGVIFPFRKSNNMLVNERIKKMRSLSINFNQNNTNYNYNTCPVDFKSNINVNLNNDFRNYKNNYNKYIENYNNRNIGIINFGLSNLKTKKSYRNLFYKNAPLIPFSPIKNYTLLINLEETIINIPKGTNNIYLRPFLREFLSNIYPYYEIFVFSSGIKNYVEQIINFIEDKEQYFDYKLYRENTNYSDENYYLDINKLGRDLKRIIVIDHKFNYGNNGILINSFQFDEINNYILNDNILFHLEKILIQIAKEEPNDIRINLMKYKNEINLKLNDY